MLLPELWCCLSTLFTSLCAMASFRRLEYGIAFEFAATDTWTALMSARADHVAPPFTWIMAVPGEILTLP